MKRKTSTERREYIFYRAYWEQTLIMAVSANASPEHTYQDAQSGRTGGFHGRSSVDFHPSRCDAHGALATLGPHQAKYGLP